MNQSNSVYRLDLSGFTPPSEMSLAELVESIALCGYRCEAGPLELNVCFLELRRRADRDRVDERAILLASELFDLALKYMNSEIGQGEFQAACKEIWGKFKPC